MFVSVRSDIGGAVLERVCVVAGGVAYVPSGRSDLRPGETSPKLAVEAATSGQRGAVYFELSAGPRTLRFVTDELFDVTPRADIVIAIGNDTVAHVASVEVEGAVARLPQAAHPDARRIRR